MAKKKAPDPSPKTPARGPRRTVLTIKGYEEWKDWLDGLGKHVRTPTSTIVDHALVDYAKKVGYPPEVPER